jgi:hypothetical protein
MVEVNGASLDIPLDKGNKLPRRKQRGIKDLYKEQAIRSKLLGINPK